MKTSQKDLIYWSIITIVLLIGFSISMYSIGEVNYSGKTIDSNRNRISEKLAKQKENSPIAYDENGEAITSESESLDAGSGESDNIDESKLEAELETAESEQDEIMEGEELLDEGEEIYLEKDLDENGNYHENIDLEVIEEDESVEL